MTRPIAVVPHGTGIGDTVNLRPLVSAVVAHRPDTEVQVMVPQSLAWLLPEGVRAMPDRWMRFWQRPPPRSIGAGAASRIDPRLTAPLVRGAAPLAARGLSQYLTLRGYEPVSLLEAFSELDLDSRWTPGPWSGDRRHVIDLLAEWLEARGIPTPAASRAPRLHAEPRLSATSATVVLSPNAGSTLKEAQIELWIDIVQKLVQEGITPHLLAAPGRDTALEIAQHVQDAVLLHIPDLRDVAAVLAGADVVVGPDSGILHLAAAIGTRYVGLFGSTDHVFLGPYDRSLGAVVQTPVRHEVVCRSCWTAQMLPVARCGMGIVPSCLSGITATEVVEVVRHMMTT